MGDPTASTGKPSLKSTPQNSILEIRFYLKEEKCGDKM
jgi:hypothetical protein